MNENIEYQLNEGLFNIISDAVNTIGSENMLTVIEALEKYSIEAGKVFNKGKSLYQNQNGVESYYYVIDDIRNNMREFVKTFDFGYNVKDVYINYCYRSILSFLKGVSADIGCTNGMMYDQVFVNMIDRYFDKMYKIVDICQTCNDVINVEKELFKRSVKQLVVR